MTLTKARGDVVVIGGGLAGISAAIELAEAGLAVTLLESRPWLGGSTCSFARRGLTIDNGQHVFLRCFTAYRDLLSKLGVASSAVIQDALDITVLAASGQARLRRSRLPAPLHLARSLACYRLLTATERAKLPFVAAALLATEVSARQADEVRLGDWLARLGQDSRSRRMFWDLVSVPILNIAGDEANLGLAVSVIRNAVLAGRDRADIGVPTVPLSKLHGAPAAELLTSLGASIRLGCKAVAVAAGPRGSYRVRLADGGTAGPPLGGFGTQTISAASVVLAVPAWEATALVPAHLCADVANWKMLDSSAVVSLHVIYHNRVTRLPFAAVMGAQPAWVMDKTSAAGLHAGQYLAVSLPAADRHVDAPSAALRAEFLPRLERLFPAAAAANVADFFVTRERRATIRQIPGSQRLRSAQPAGLPGLALAGAWTDTGWPDTMEGAVRSGHAAARKVLADLTGERGAADLARLAEADDTSGITSEQQACADARDAAPASPLRR